ncbi:hypothetical protein N072000002_04410 [Clostridium tetani]|uniref:Uncharacterized protein n=1 Tax=Clostridium tetani TaxID=1513 RepID=A0ABC8EAE6_CLOTA|nr:hypothetical protein K234311028_04370 [Clostridium tetani]BDR88640.1 hypothetical protein N072000002_04410 [Clostridium tetani]
MELCKILKMLIVNGYEASKNGSDKFIVIIFIQD